MISEAVDANVTGITVAEAQHEYAKKTLSSPKSHYLLLDYREILKVWGPEFFDSIISIGVTGHIGIKRIDEWFDGHYKSLKTGGYFVFQAILGTQALPNSNYQFTTKEKACQGYNFISKYIFKGGCLLLSDWVMDSAMRAGIGQHYARTIRNWRDSFLENRDVLLKKYDRELVLLQEFYFAHVEASYRIGVVDKVQFVLYKSAHKDFHARSFKEYMDVIEEPWQNEYDVDWKKELEKKGL
ncbi:cyclopropane-fatty-acyl-phospholipid synthase [Reticulomyxa filosa]|uniref:Cyclopropane-fatty-acyl-phospholipid synthase n=1 Tax=Reticulomyxa filosa TaxID=46433 RepID=X6M687_RETFI|nr:cyclopropane-fatty-acyl-phospholipid synthase [Reticulomyxa filosa]|eukprot:ETO09409.1 cyclopropane-fatty-acyl-phospholipid synthase [Reticulomyxa filosa]